MTLIIAIVTCPGTWLVAALFGSRFLVRKAMEYDDDRFEDHFEEFPKHVH